LVEDQVSGCDEGERPADAAIIEERIVVRIVGIEPFNNNTSTTTSWVN